MEVEVINIDIITSFPWTQRQHDSIWFIVDRVSNSTHLLIVKANDSAEYYTKFYINEIVRLHWIPFSIISYKGP